MIKELILLKSFNGDFSPCSVTFQRSPFWICVFKIPIKSMSKAVSNRIVNEIGNPLVVDTPKSGLDWGIFLHIRVDINITKPLTRGKLIKTTRFKAPNERLTDQDNEILQLCTFLFILLLIQVGILIKIIVYIFFGDFFNALCNLSSKTKILAPHSLISKLHQLKYEENPKMAIVTQHTDYPLNFL